MYAMYVQFSDTNCVPMEYEMRYAVHSHVVFFLGRIVNLLSRARVNIMQFSRLYEVRVAWKLFCGGLVTPKFISNLYLP